MRIKIARDKAVRIVIVNQKKKAKLINKSDIMVAIQVKANESKP